MKQVFAICGSTKTDSANHALLQTIQQLCSDTLNITIYNGLDQLPYFDPNPESENNHPQVVEFRRHIQHADGVIICTPEYVFSLPGILKNALEWTVSNDCVFGQARCTHYGQLIRKNGARIVAPHYEYAGCGYHAGNMPAYPKH